MEPPLKPPVSGTKSPASASAKKSLTEVDLHKRSDDELYDLATSNEVAMRIIKGAICDAESVSHSNAPSAFGMSLEDLRAREEDLNAESRRIHAEFDYRKALELATEEARKLSIDSAAQSLGKVSKGIMRECKDGDGHSVFAPASPPTLPATKEARRRVTAMPPPQIKKG